MCTEQLPYFFASFSSSLKVLNMQIKVDFWWDQIKTHDNFQSDSTEAKNISSLWFSSLDKTVLELI